jgi:hypothetical protein
MRVGARVKGWVVNRFIPGANPAGWADIFFIVYIWWVAFEWTIVSRLPGLQVIQMVRNTMDILPIGLFILSILVLNIRFRETDTRILLAFAAILVVSSLSLFIETGSVKSITGWIGVTFRFVPLILLVRFTTPGFRNKLLTHVKIIYWLLAALAFISLINREAFNQFFLPSPDLFGEVLPTTYTDPGISATFINTVEFSFFILALTIYYLFTTPNPKERLIVCLTSLSLIVLSFSIASILALLLVFFLRGRRKWLMGSILAGFLIMVVIVFSGFIQEMLGMDFRYWIDISSEFNRLGYFTKVLPEFLHGNLKDIILGMGYDAGVVDLKVTGYRNTPFVMINNENNLKYLKDVYWLSILLVQGVIALLISFYIGMTIYRTAAKKASANDFAQIRSLILVALLLGFFNQVLDIKGFTFLFWLVTGLILNEAFARQVQHEAA